VSEFRFQVWRGNFEPGHLLRVGPRVTRILLLASLASSTSFNSWGFPDALSPSGRPDLRSRWIPAYVVG
jgi:hypothetical protein